MATARAPGEERATDASHWGRFEFSPTIALLHLALGGLTAGLTTIAARRLGLAEARAAAAGLIVALDPLLVVRSREVMTETLAAALLAWALAATARPGRGSGAETGLALGLAALCRPSTLAISTLVIAFSAATGPGPWRRRVARTAAIGGTILLVLTPWASRNRFAVGEFVWTTTHGGYTLALGNNADYYRDVLDGPPGAVWDAARQREWARGIAVETDRLPEPEADRRLSAQARAFLRERPRDFFRASVARLGRLWAVAPSPAVYGPGVRWACVAWNLPLLAAALLGLARRASWRWPGATATGMVLGITCVHALYWTDMRMRAPVVPAVALLAASARFEAPRKK